MSNLAAFINVSLNFKDNLDPPIFSDLIPMLEPGVAGCLCFSGAVRAANSKGRAFWALVQAGGPRSRATNSPDWL